MAKYHVKYLQLDSLKHHTIPSDHFRSTKNDVKFAKILRVLLYIISGLLVFISAVALSICVAKFVRHHASEDENFAVIIQEHNESLQCNIEENNRFDCWPEIDGGSEDKCRQRGCCWKPSSKPGTAPYCFFPSKYDGYIVTHLEKSSRGYEGNLTRTTKTFFSEDVMTVALKIDYLNEHTLRIKLYDPSKNRFEVPLELTPAPARADVSPMYNVTVLREPFNLLVTRIGSGETVFDTRSTAPLIFSDQFLQIATGLSSKFLYGLGEHRNSFLQDLATWRRLPFWNRDHVPAVDMNGYGSHPFFLNLESTSVGGSQIAHGVFLLNSNAAEAALQPFSISGTQSGAVTYRTLGGILDFYLFMGPDPVSVVQQYSSLIGRAYLPPFWSLGFHLCKYGYKNQSELEEVIERNRNAEMPYDVQWSDIDYMSEHKDWTFDNKTFSNLSSIVQDLHDNSQRFIVIVDPGISSTGPADYPAWKDGVDMDIFVKDSEGDILVGEVWPGQTAFPDFFHPNATEYWYKQAKTFHEQIPFDGLWMDMNEPSNFVDGSVKGCDKSTLNYPPYIPPTIYEGSLVKKTVCPSAKHYLSTHYNLHNMYGWSEANVTRGVIQRLMPDRRSPLITRSSYAGSGKNTGHWLGDNNSGFKELYYSIPGILNFNLFGIPQIGADICGFLGNTTPVLCVRWHQLGVFYPFMRNHADFQSTPQDPAVFPSPYRDYIRQSLQLRYRLLAVLYNAFFEAHILGSPIVRPLFYLYPGTEAIDRQFMWRDQLLISPVLDKGATTVQAYFPKDVWYDFFNGSAVRHVGDTVTLDASLDTINVHVRGGNILPLLPPTLRTDLSREKKFELLIAPNSTGQAQGFLFWDDGQSSDSISAKKYSHIIFNFEQNTLTSRVDQSGYSPSHGIRVGEVTSLGVLTEPAHVLVNGHSHNFTYGGETQVLTVTDLDIDLLTPLNVTWA